MTSADSETHVLMSPHLDDKVPNPTVKLLVDALPDDIHSSPFSWREALFGTYDVLHVHWPEGLLRGRSWLHIVVARLRFLALALRIFTRKIPVVWTVHDDRPLEKGPIGEGVYLWLWNKMVTRRVFMFDSVIPTPASSRDVVIRHGSYARLFPLGADPRKEKIIPGRVVIFGHIRPYKGIEEFITTLSDFPESEFSLVIAGSDHFPGYTRLLRATAAGLANISIDARYLTNDDVEELILTAEVVVLPNQKIYNSGVALLALTLKRPIIVQKSLTMTELASEVSGNWVSPTHFPTTPTEFLIAYRRARLAHKQADPDMKQRDWTHAAHEYAAIFREIGRNGPRAR